MNDKIAAEHDRIIEQHGPMVLRAAFSILRDRELARDAAQEMIGVYLAHLIHGQAVERPGPWLHRVATLQASLILRRRESSPSEVARHSHAIDPMVREQDLPPDLAEYRELLEALKRAVAGLPPRCRRVFGLRTAGVSMDDIASELKISKRTVGVDLAYAYRSSAATWAGFEERGRSREAYDTQSAAPRIGATAAVARAPVPIFVRRRVFRGIPRHSGSRRAT